MSSARTRDLDSAHSPAPGDEALHGALGELDDLRLVGGDPRGGPLRVAHLAKLHLGDHQRRVGVRDEATARAHHLGGVRGGRDDARLLDDHRHHVVVAVDAHVERDAVGQAVGAEHVLDELVGGLGVEAPAVERALDVDARRRRSRRSRARAAPGR